MMVTILVRLLCYMIVGELLQSFLKTIVRVLSSPSKTCKSYLDSTQNCSQSSKSMCPRHTMTTFFCSWSYTWIKCHSSKLWINKLKRKCFSTWKCKLTKKIACYTLSTKSQRICGSFRVDRLRSIITLKMTKFSQSRTLKEAVSSATTHSFLRTSRTPTLSVCLLSPCML